MSEEREVDAEQERSRAPSAEKQECEVKETESPVKRDEVSTEKSQSLVRDDTEEENQMPRNELEKSVADSEKQRTGGKKEVGKVLDMAARTEQLLKQSQLMPEEVQRLYGLEARTSDEGNQADGKEPVLVQQPQTPEEPASPQPIVQALEGESQAQEQELPPKKQSQTLEASKRRQPGVQWSDIVDETESEALHAAPAQLAIPMSDEESPTLSKDIQGGEAGSKGTIRPAEFSGSTPDIGNPVKKRVSNDPKYHQKQLLFSQEIGASWLAEKWEHQVALQHSGVSANSKEEGVITLIPSPPEPIEIGIVDDASGQESIEG
ncbi:hypothetical protein R1sor_016429 [Riccia sorocarpa]|uniref:Uncharacterized protein n=1 Tax=Riccia sorocarpa TaxID=122646 RepID=A0ABD3HEY2_9MARC